MPRPTGPVLPVLAGDFRISSEPVVLSTVLGSCVAACLFDPVTHVAGMNHFLLPEPRFADSRPLGLSQAGRYGIDAMELLINAMLKAGADRRRLRAKAFGGAALMNLPRERPEESIGDSNVRFLRAFLQLEGIPLDAEDFGGQRGRVIRFHTDTFDVWRRYIHSVKVEARVKDEEAEALRRQQARLASQGDVTLFW